jgi:regulatory protein YycI of two-component signal transduction system YycFG
VPKWHLVTLFFISLLFSKINPFHVDLLFIKTKGTSVSEAPKKSTSIEIDKIHTTEMTLKEREKQTPQTPQNHLQVSTEFLGGRFDTKG